MLQNRPKPENNKMFAEILFDAFGISFTLIAIIFIIVKWSDLPETIPMHFNLAGEPDGWGSRWTLIILPVIGIVMWIGLHFLEKYPQSHNYMWLTEENAQRQYKNSQLLLNVIKNIIVIFFSYLTFDSIHIALGEKSLLGVWELPLFLISLFAPMAFFVYRSYRLK